MLKEQKSVAITTAIAVAVLRSLERCQPFPLCSISWTWMLTDAGLDHSQMGELLNLRCRYYYWCAVPGTSEPQDSPQLGSGGIIY